jgi:hypothetical protein
MGYYSTITGEISFEPPASYGEIRSLSDKDRLFRFVQVAETQETEEGTLTKVSARRIEPVLDEVEYVDDRIKAYSMESDLTDFRAALPNRRWSGEFRVEGEEAGDVQRLFVDDKGHVVLWKARLLWPDGTSEPAR